MTLKKTIMVVLLGVFVAGGVYLYFNFATMLTRTVERIATNALGVSVDIGAINLSLKDKTATVHNIKIGNPKGYKQPYAITAGRIDIGLNTVGRDLIDFKTITVKDSEVYLEVNEGGMNLLDLKEQAQSRKSREQSAEEAVRVIVKQMVIDASTIHSKITFLDRDIATIKMPAVRMTNLGQGGGVSAGSAVADVLVKYVNAAVAEARNSQVLSGVTLPGSKDVEKIVDDVTEGIKGLFR